MTDRWRRGAQSGNSRRILWIFWPAEIGVGEGELHGRRTGVVQRKRGNAMSINSPKRERPRRPASPDSHSRLPFLRRPFPRHVTEIHRENYVTNAPGYISSRGNGAPLRVSAWKIAVSTSSRKPRLRADNYRGLPGERRTTWPLET